jgi:outer membrane receptor protein involved in Fe transport
MGLLTCVENVNVRSEGRSCIRQTGRSVNTPARLRLFLCAAALVVALCAAAPSAAAETASEAPPDSAPTDATSAAIEEVVITAQKRSENIQKVGMAITARTAEQLVEKGVTNLADLTQILPSLQFSQSQSGTPIYTLRGVGYFEQSLSASPTVSIYQDEVPFPFPVMSKGVLLDPERVEILVGPQGTLYGQNATGGAINFIAAKPTHTFAAGFDETFGRFNHNLFSGFLSGPLTSTLSARLAVSTENGGAWQQSVTRNDTLGDKDTQIGRLILEWTPTEDFRANLNVNGWRDRSDTQAGQLEGFHFQTPQGVATGSVSDAAFYRPAPIGSPAFLAYPAVIQAVLRQPVAPNDPRAADWIAGTHPRNDESFYQSNLHLDYSLSDALGVTSLTSYQYFKEDNRVDQAGVGVPEGAGLIHGNVKSYSEELRLHGVAADKKLNWLLGLNYESDKSAENDDIDPFYTSTSFITVGGLGLPPFLQFGRVNTDNTITKSVFGNVEYQVLDSLDVHGGVRYTRSDQEMTGCTYDTYPSVTILQNIIGGQLASLDGGTSVPVKPGQCITLGPPPNYQNGLQTNTLNQSNVPWRVGIDWTPIPNNLFYFTVSKGYKAGSSPAVGASRYYQLRPVNQESVLAYELGSKSELFDRTLQLNLSVFHYDYTDKQELGRLWDPIHGALQVLLNIPKSTEDGAEFSVVWRPFAGLTLNAAGTYLDSRVTSHFFDLGPYPLGPTDLIDFKGEAFPFTPKWSVQYGARYDWHLVNSLTAFVSADASYQSTSSAAFGYQEAITEGAPPLEIKAFGLLNVAAGIDQGHWRAQVWGKNVTNRYYWNSNNFVFDTVVKQAGMPATYGITLNYRY